MYDFLNFNVLFKSALKRVNDSCFPRPQYLTKENVSHVVVDSIHRKKVRNIFIEGGRGVLPVKCCID